MRPVENGDISADLMVSSSEIWVAARSVVVVGVVGTFIAIMFVLPV